MKKINELIPPSQGLFYNMPDDTIFEGLDKSLLDIEFFTTQGGRYSNTLADYYLDKEDPDIEGLSNLIWQRFSKPWSRMYSALEEEYQIFITSTTDYTISRNESGLVDSTENVVTGTTRELSNEIENQSVTNRNGSVKTTDNVVELADDRTTTDQDVVQDYSSNTDTSNTRTDALNTSTTDTLTKSGSEKTNVTRDNSDNLTKTGSEVRATTGGGSETTTKTGSEKHDTDNTVTYNSTTNDSIDELTKDSGTVGTTVTNSNDMNAFGSSSSTKTTGSSTDSDENRNLTIDRTGNNSSKKTGSDTTVGTDTLTFTGRTDATEIEKDETETTTFNARKDAHVITESGSDTLTFTGRTDKTDTETSNTGTVEDVGGETAEGSSTESVTGVTNNMHLRDTHTDNTVSYDNLADENVEFNLGSSSEIADENQDRVGNVVSENNFNEEYHSEGSTPLKTFQQLIEDEVNLRRGPRYNFVDLVMLDIANFITLSMMDLNRKQKGWFYE